MSHERALPYQLVIAAPAAKALASVIPEKVAAAIVEFITGPLLEHPHRVGKQLDPPLATAYSARRGTYRLLYLIYDEDRLVTVTAVRHRADAYR